MTNKPQLPRVDLTPAAIDKRLEEIEATFARWGNYVGAQFHYGPTSADADDEGRTVGTDPGLFVSYPHDENAIDPDTGTPIPDVLAELVSGADGAELDLAAEAASAYFANLHRERCALRALRDLLARES
jgi:hypothetical protein